jgi:hypothetical protein
MPGGIFLLDPRGELTEMSESPLKSELDFQYLLAHHPSGVPCPGNVTFWKP